MRGWLVLATLLVASAAQAQGFGPSPVIQAPVPMAVVFSTLLLMLIGMRRDDQRARLPFAIAAAGVAFGMLYLANLPLQLALGFALLVLCRRAAAAPEMLVGALVLSAATLLDQATAAEAVLFISSSALQVLGVSHSVVAPSLSLANGLVEITPACAGVESIGVAFVLSLALHAAQAAPRRRIWSAAFAHAATMAVMNVVRIVAIAIAMNTSLAAAEATHAWGGLALVLVHLPFVVYALRKESEKHVGRMTAALQQPRRASGVVLGGLLLASQAHAADGFAPLGNAGVDALDVRIVNEHVLQRAELKGFSQTVPGKRSKLDVAAVRRSAQKATIDRVLTGELAPAGDEDTFELRLTILVTSNDKVASVRGAISGSDDEAGIRKLVDRVIKESKRVHGDKPVAAPAPTMPLATALPPPAPVAAPPPPPPPAPALAPTVAAAEPAAEAPAVEGDDGFMTQAKIYALPAGLGLAGLSAGLSAIGVGLWAGSDVATIRAGQASDVDGAKTGAISKSVASDVLAVTAVGLTVSAVVTGVLGFLQSQPVAAEAS